MVVPVDGTGVGDEGDMKAPNGAEGAVADEDSR